MTCLPEETPASPTVVWVWPCGRESRHVVERAAVDRRLQGGAHEALCGGGGRRRRGSSRDVTMRVTPAATRTTTARPTATAMRRVRRLASLLVAEGGLRRPRPTPGCPGKRSARVRGGPHDGGGAPGGGPYPGIGGYPGRGDGRGAGATGEEAGGRRWSSGGGRGLYRGRRVVTGSPVGVLRHRVRLRPACPVSRAGCRCQPVGGRATGARATTRRDEAWTRSTPSCSKGRRSSVARDRNWMRACWLQSRHARDSGGSDG